MDYQFKTKDIMKTKKSKLAQMKAFFIRIVRRSFLFKQADDRLNDVDFYDLMQAYRHTPMNDQKKTVERYEAVKDWIRQNYA
jgi:hypothetical protein